jgi:hypothetical protein
MNKTLLDCKLTLQDPLRRWLRDYANITNTTTIRQLLNHTSGVFDWVENTAIVRDTSTDAYHNFLCGLALSVGGLRMGHHALDNQQGRFLGPCRPEARLPFVQRSLSHAEHHRRYSGQPG